MSLQESLPGGTGAAGTGLSAALAPFDLVADVGTRPVPDAHAEPAAAAKRQPARLRLVQPDDLAAVWRFCARFYDVYRGCSHDDFRGVWEHRWRHNPATRPDHPLGWVLETPGREIVGFSGLVPMALKVGPERVTALCGANWVIHPDHRRHSVPSFRAYAACGARYMMLSTGLSPAVARIHARYGMGMERIPVAGVDQRLWWVIDPKRFLAWKLGQLGAASALWRAIAAVPGLSSAASAVWPIALGVYTDPEHRVLRWLARSEIAFDCPPLPVERVTWFTDEFDAFWDEHRDRYDVMAERTSMFLNWRHFLLPKVAGECFALACRDRGRLLGYLTLQTPGYRGRLPGCFTVTDLFYPAEREDVFRNLMNAAFRFAVERGGVVLKMSGFHPAVHEKLATQRPHVIDPDTLRTLARGRLGRGVLATLGLGERSRPAASRPAEGSYWYKAPSPELARICRSGSWWPTPIDGTVAL